MKALQLPIVYILISCVLRVLILLPPEVHSIIRNVGQDVIFMWNRTSGSIGEVRWGLVDPADNQGVKPQFIYVRPWGNLVVYSSELDTPAASSYKGRVHYVGDVPAGRAWFKITNISISDSNDYAVSILEGSVYTLYKMSLIVTVTPKFQPQPPLTKNITEGQDLRVPCTAVGQPKPNVKWVQIDGHAIKRTGTGSATLRIPNIRRDQNGTYECQARNNPNERPVTAQTMVVVYYLPGIDTSESSMTLKSWNGNSIHLRCFATGLPAPRISWYKPTNQQIITGVNIVPGGSEVTVLTTADQGDYGQYKCRATNILGSDEHVINVTQLFTPGPVTMTITEIEASSANVRWTKSADDGGRAVTGYLLETDSHIFVRTIDTYTVLTGLKKDSQYRVTVYAKNDIGYGVSSTKIITTKKTGRPDIPELLTSLLIEAESKIKVLLRWKKPDDNGATISRYTIYIKEENEQSDWNKIEDVKDSLLLECNVGTTIKYGKTYKFTVTAWNKYGESIKDERNVKTVNTTADKTAYVSGKSVNSGTMGGSKYITTVRGMIIAVLVLSLGLNLRQFLWPRIKDILHCLKGKQGNQRIKKAADEEIYSNDLEMDKKVVSAVTTSRPQPPSNTGPECERIQQLNEIASPQEEIPQEEIPQEEIPAIL